MNARPENSQLTPDGTSVSRDSYAGAASLAGASVLPPVEEATAVNAVFLRLIDVTDDANVRNYLRRILAVAD